MTIGTGEIIMLAIILLVVFSASRMASLGNAIGRFVYSFKKASRGHDLIDVNPGPRLEKGTEDAEVIDAPPKH